MAHTPTPWHLFRDEINDETGLTVAHVVTFVPRYKKQSDANAAFIVKAVNAHDDLVAALERTLSWLTSYPGHGAMAADGPYQQARAALAKAEATS